MSTLMADVQEQQARTFLVVGDLLKILVNRQETDGHYIVAETFTNPGSGMPILHTHPSHETFLVLDGQFEIYRQDEAGNKFAIPATAGDVIHVPGNAPHGYANVGEEQGRLILILDGAGRMDDFFGEIGIPVEDEDNLPVLEGPPDMEAIVATCIRYGMTFVEAPPA